MIERSPRGLPPVVIVNGAECSHVSALDRGLAYGDGVFRTLAVREGVPDQWQRQYTKLAADCARLRLSAPEQGTLRADVERASRSLTSAAVKIIVTRGNGPRGYRFVSATEASRMVMASASPADPPEHSRVGVRARMCTLRLGHQPALAGVKHLNRLENVLARAEWNDPDTLEGILCDARDNVVCGTMSNVFVAHGPRLSTPDLTLCGVAGVTRDRVLAAAKRHGVTCEVRHMQRKELAGANEIFFVNSLIGVWPVAVLGEREYGIGPWARAAQGWLAEDDDGTLS